MATSGPREVPPDLAGELGELYGVEQDLEATKDYCERLRRELSDFASADWTLVYALSEAAVVRYVRCFTKGIRLSLDPEYLTPTGREVHSWFLNLRNKHIAHSVNEFENWSVVVHVVEAPDPAAVHHVSMGAGRIGGLSLDLVESLFALCDTALEHLRPRIERLRLSVEEAVLSRPIDEVYSWRQPAPFPPSTGLHVARDRSQRKKRKSPNPAAQPDGQRTDVHWPHG
jgi:hypothetical protein